MVVCVPSLYKCSFLAFKPTTLGLLLLLLLFFACNILQGFLVISEGYGRGSRVRRRKRNATEGVGQDGRQTVSERYHMNTRAYEPIYAGGREQLLMITGISSQERSARKGVLVQHTACSVTSSRAW